MVNSTITIRTILIANRGEIACRIMRTNRRLGIRSVAVFSSVDAHAKHVREADEAIYIGEASPAASYLSINNILEAAKLCGADAIHPGYGFLAENSDLAKACDREGIIFIGPNADAIKAMGSKSAAKEIMRKAGVPLIPGYYSSDQQAEIFKCKANDMGYPVLLKASAGGGGKGMRIVSDEKDFMHQWSAAQREAQSAFGDGTLLLEKYLQQPRHVEVQVFGDQHRNYVYLFDRDCSIQRRHQKIIEEAPAPGLNDNTRKAMGEAAIKAASAINYVNAGTIEFLVDEQEQFYFMEMNTRLQVEHPVTEMISSEDLVAWQIAVAEGKPLPKNQQQLKQQGHAIEVRIYAENPDNDFLPASGTCTHLNLPKTDKHIRIDSGIEQGDIVSPYYDPMVAKLIAYGQNRDKAIEVLENALEKSCLSGFDNNIPFLYDTIRLPAFKLAKLNTHFLEQQETLLQTKTPPPENIAVAAVAYFLFICQQNQPRSKHETDQHSTWIDPWQQQTGWTNVGNRKHRVSLQHLELQIDVDIAQRGEQFTVLLYQHSQEPFEIAFSAQLSDTLLQYQYQQIQKQARVHIHRGTGTQADKIDCLLAGQRFVFRLINDTFSLENEHSGHMRAPMNGRIVAVLTEPNKAVKKGDPLVILEAMKMEHTIYANSDGTITNVFCQSGELVDEGFELVEIET